MKKDIYTDFDEYIKQGEPDKKEKASIWRTAIGLQAVDGLKTSDYLKETACKHIEGKIAVHVLTDADGALLSVDDFIRAIVSRCPVHHIERKTLRKRVNHGIALVFFIDKFALIRRADVQFAAVCLYTVFGIVNVAVCQFSYGDFV